MADVSVRPARVGEASEIARIQRDTLTMAYDAILPLETFSRLADPQTQSAVTAAIAAEIAAAGPSARVLVALEGDQIVGLASARAAIRNGGGDGGGGGDDDDGGGGGGTLLDSDPDPERTGYLEQLLVEPRWGRRGHGSRLLAAVADFFTEAGFTRAVTWVPEQNAPTVNFLTSAGWARDGYVRGLDTGGGVPLREIRLHTAL